ncbi:MAG: uncharacterized protein A8A55_1302 [Amphiamblys sp. WSBS2006]|nr:MAG: uncharacterized protein A8A55_1302 [Amphiamblys sp. WSBS2006]
MWTLELFDEAGAHAKTFLVPTGTWTLGRDASNIKIENPHVSRLHCVLEATPGALSVFDRSRYGTTIDGEKIDEAPLDNNSRLGLVGYSGHLLVRKTNVSLWFSERNVPEELAKKCLFLGMETSKERTEESTHFVSLILKTSERLLLALIHQMKIVDTHWIEKTLEGVHGDGLPGETKTLELPGSFSLPRETLYTPVPKDQDTHIDFEKNEKRKSLFAGITFLTALETKKKRLEKIITGSGGRVVCTNEENPSPPETKNTKVSLDKNLLPTCSAIVSDKTIVAAILSGEPLRVGQSEDSPLRPDKENQENDFLFRNNVSSVPTESASKRRKSFTKQKNKKYVRESQSNGNSPLPHA